MALLHSFWYEEARKDFESIAQQDFRCDIAYWGIAMTYWSQVAGDWPSNDDVKVARQALAKARTPASSRERAYIKAIADFYGASGQPDFRTQAQGYSAAMMRIHEQYPDDQEAAAFYGLSILAAQPEDESKLAIRKQAAAVLEKLFAQNPNHPGAAHYLIHTYDRPQLAQLGLPDARQYARIAPSSPHALHMPSHIFARLGLWQEDIDSNLASIAGSDITMTKHMGGGAHQFHAMDYLIYAYLQCGRESDAAQLIERMKQMPHKDDFVLWGTDWQLYQEAEASAVYALELHHWSEAAALSPMPEAPLMAQVFPYWARAIGAGHLKNAAEARRSAEQAEVIHQKMLDAKLYYFRESVENLVREAEAWADYADGKTKLAIETMWEVAEKEDTIGSERPAILIPARELLADMLVDMKSPQRAIIEYEATLKLNPNRFDSLYGAAWAAELSGNLQKAKDYYRQLLTICKGAPSERPELIFARKAFYDSNLEKEQGPSVPFRPVQIMRSDGTRTRGLLRGRRSESVFRASAAVGPSPTS